MNESGISAWRPNIYILSFPPRRTDSVNNVGMFPPGLETSYNQERKICSPNRPVAGSVFSSPLRQMGVGRKDSAWANQSGEGAQRHFVIRSDKREEEIVGSDIYDYCNDSTGSRKWARWGKA